MKFQLEIDDPNSVLDMDFIINKIKSTKKFRILRDINGYKEGDIVPEENLPLVRVSKVRQYNVLFYLNTAFEIMTFKQLSKKEVNEWEGFYVERIP
jgi:hypothetical protein